MCIFNGMYCECGTYFSAVMVNKSQYLYKTHSLYQQLNKFSSLYFSLQGKFITSTFLSTDVRTHMGNYIPQKIIRSQKINRQHSFYIELLWLVLVTVTDDVNELYILMMKRENKTFIHISLPSSCHKIEACYTNTWIWNAKQKKNSFSLD